MKHKAQYTTQQLINLRNQCHDIRPVFGRPEGQKPLWHAPRTKFDPRPWTDGFFRYSAYELTAEPQHSPEVTDEQWVEQRHYADLDGSDTAFTRMFDRQPADEAPQGVAA